MQKIVKKIGSFKFFVIVRPRSDDISRQSADFQCLNS
jgi:hypothetical protein